MERKDYNWRQAYQLLHEGILALAKAERQGLRVDENYLRKSKIRVEKKIKILEKELYETKFYRRWVHSLGGKTPNINSGLQLSNYLYKVRKIKADKTTVKGNPSIDEEALRNLNIPELNILLELRKLKKIKDTYLTSYGRESTDGVLHPFFNLHNVVSYRSSSDSPNFQNVPKRDKQARKIIRSSIFPREGHQFLEVDFSGIEVSIATCYHKDPVMINYLTEKKDLHGDIAKQLFFIDKLDKSIPEHAYLRGAAKNNFVFPQFYGDYYKNCASNLCNNWLKLPLERKWNEDMGVEISGGISLVSHLKKNGIKSYSDFEKHIKEMETDFWYKRFKVYREWKEHHYKNYIGKGFVESETGFTYKNIMSRNEVINYPVQGSAFHCLLWCFVRLTKISEKENWDTKLVGQVHDSMLFDVHPSELAHISKIIKKVTTSDLLKAYKWINVPLSIEAEITEVDESWNKLKHYDI